MNWGKGIIAGMTIFMTFILALCFQMFRAPADEYDHQYYEKGLNYDKDFARAKRTVDNHAQPTFAQSGSQLVIRFTDKANGSARLVRPSSQALDKTFPLISDSDNDVTLPLNNVEKGRWHLVIEWQSTGNDYLYEKEIDIK